MITLISSIIFLTLWILSGITTNYLFFKDNGSWIDFDEKLTNILTGIFGLIFYIFKNKIFKKKA